MDEGWEVARESQVAGFMKANNCGLKASEIHRASAWVMLAISFFSVKSCWVCLWSRSVGITIIPGNSMTTIGFPCFSFLILRYLWYKYVLSLPVFWWSKYNIVPFYSASKCWKIWSLTPLLIFLHTEISISVVPSWH